MADQSLPNSPYHPARHLVSSIDTPHTPPLNPILLVHGQPALSSAQTECLADIPKPDSGQFFSSLKIPPVSYTSTYW